MVPLTNADHLARLFGALSTTQHVSMIFQYSHTGARAPRQAVCPLKRQFSFLNHSEYTPEVISGFDEN